MTSQSTMSNERFISEFREWRSKWKMPVEQIEEEVSYISRLAEFMAPVSLCKVTKAVMQDFYLEEQMRQQPRESRSNIMRAAIAFDAFRADFKPGSKKKAEKKQRGVPTHP